MGTFPLLVKKIKDFIKLRANSFILYGILFMGTFPLTCDLFIHEFTKKINPEKKKIYDL